jgi:hypothetical protein
MWTIQILLINMEKLLGEKKVTWMQHRIDYVSNLYLLSLEFTKERLQSYFSLIWIFFEMCLSKIHIRLLIEEYDIRSFFLYLLKLLFSLDYPRFRRAFWSWTFSIERWTMEKCSIYCFTNVLDRKTQSGNSLYSTLSMFDNYSFSSDVRSNEWY